VRSQARRTRQQPPVLRQERPETLQSRLSLSAPLRSLLQVSGKELSRLDLRFLSHLEVVSERWPGCSGERSSGIAELASFYGQGSTVGQVLRRMRCAGACGGPVAAAWLATGPILNARIRPRRVPLLGAEARE
jgi:hypothetical protein